MHCSININFTPDDGFFNIETRLIIENKSRYNLLIIKYSGNMKDCVPFKVVAWAPHINESVT
jgi:hypothetical protein